MPSGLPPTGNRPTQRIEAGETRHTHMRPSAIRRSFGQTRPVRGYEPAGDVSHRSIVSLLRTSHHSSG